MVHHPAVVCAVDFSNASRGALRYAAALVEHFQSDLTVLTVDDPLLTSAAAANWGEGWLAAQSEEHLHTFVKEVFPERSPQPAKMQVMVKSGQPATEILRTASEQQADLIVMSSHGATGFQRLVFGSTTARLLRQTTFPVLVTPATDPGPDDLEDVRRTTRTILVPVDLSAVTGAQVRIAAGLAEGLGSKILLTHVLEPISSRRGHDLLVSQIDRERRAATHETLSQLQASLPSRVQSEILLAYGNPAREIAWIAQQRHVGAIVMGLHSADGIGPRIGSITYRVLCEAPALVLALPPVLAAPAASQNEIAHSAVVGG
jgi:nucleotide-binding universal stress UspA family protein